ncbi:MAG: hypothetical protein HQK66_05705 [Desulfamplus sp.]|nr:hypothetical protein [Desulfamplus sp.]
MKLTTKGKILKLILNEECTIIDVEEHTEFIRNLPDKIEAVHLKVDGVREIDTAYLQCIHALKKEADGKNIAFETIGRSVIIDHACTLYGLEPPGLSSAPKKKQKTEHL